MMIGQSATGQVELRPFINYLWCSLKFFPLFAIIKSLWRSCEVQWCDLLRLWSVQTFCQSLSTHNQGHEIYNLSEKELLYKQRISLELLEVKSILSVGFKIWHYLILHLGGFVSNLSPLRWPTGSPLVSRGSEAWSYMSFRSNIFNNCDRDHWHEHGYVVGDGWVIMAKLRRIFFSRCFPNLNIAKGTTDPRVGFISQDHKSWRYYNFRISMKR